MKKMIAMAILMSGMMSFAQEKPQAPRDEKVKREQFTPEQRSELKLKELTLKLDLSASQQKEMAKLLADTEAKKEAARAEMKKAKESGKKPTADERFQKRSKMLDEQIAMKDRIKKILNPEQMEKWEKMKDEKKQHVKKAVKERRDRKKQQD